MNRCGRTWLACLIGFSTRMILEAMEAPIDGWAVVPWILAAFFFVEWGGDK